MDASSPSGDRIQDGVAIGSDIDERSRVVRHSNAATAPGTGVAAGFPGLATHQRVPMRYPARRMMHRYLYPLQFPAYLGPALPALFFCPAFRWGDGAREHR